MNWTASSSGVATTRWDMRQTEERRWLIVGIVRNGIGKMRTPGTPLLLKSFSMCGSA